MIAHGLRFWRVWAGISILAILPAGCTFPQVPGQSTWLDSFCRSEQPVLLEPISPIVDLAVDAHSIYMLTRANPNSVSKISRSNGEFQLLAELSADTRGILVDEHWIYWVEGSWESSSDFFLMKVSKQGGVATRLWHAPDPILQLKMDEDYIYWLDSEASSVWQMAKKVTQVGELISGVPDLSNFSLHDGILYLGGPGGLRMWKPGVPLLQSVITSDQLLQDLNIGLRDDRSIYVAGPVLAAYGRQAIFSFYVANYPGMISCTDNAAHIVSLSDQDGPPLSLLTVEGALVDSSFIAPYLYTLGNCRGGQLINVDTGGIAATAIGYDAFSLVADREYLFWSDQDGLKCMLRPEME